MNIHIGGEWFLESDNLNLILKQKCISKQKGKSFGKEVIKERGFYSNIETLLNSLLDKGIKQSDAECLIDLKNDVADIRELLKGFCFNNLWEENEDLRNKRKEEWEMKEVINGNFIRNNL